MKTIFLSFILFFGFTSFAQEKSGTTKLIIKFSHNANGSEKVLQAMSYYQNVLEFDQSFERDINDSLHFIVHLNPGDSLVYSGEYVSPETNSIPVTQENLDSLAYKSSGGNFIVNTTEGYAGMDHKIIQNAVILEPMELNFGIDYQFHWSGYRLSVLFDSIEPETTIIAGFSPSNIFYVTGVEAGTPTFVCLYDVSGQLVLDEKIYQDQSFPVDNLKSGYYIVRVESANETLLNAKLFR